MLNFKNKTVLVVGDAMTDEFIYGHISRKSPEADCDVFLVDRRVKTPGGAANAARNIEALGARAILLSGVDGINKTRIVIDNKHILRIDDDEARFIDIETSFNEAMKQSPDAILISDYGKGTFGLIPNIISVGKKLNIPIVVDPKGTDYSKYNGATVVTPNKFEFNQASKLSNGNILIKCGENGMVLQESGKVAFNIAPYQVVAKDVAGAGDTVAAALTLMLACGHSLKESAQVSNICAALSVAKEGVSTVSVDELNKVLRRNNNQIGFCNGCFDLFHPGHFYFLWNAKQQCEQLFVGINTDESVRRLKGDGRPIQSFHERMSLVKSLYFVSKTFQCDDPLDPLIEKISPDIVFRGYDQEAPVNINWVRIPQLKDFSTTRFING